MEVGLRYPQKFAGLVGISGWVCALETVLKELSPVARNQRFLLTHGTFDPLVPIGRTRQQVVDLRGAGLNVEWHEFAKPHTLAGEEEIRVIRDFVRKGYEQVEGN